MIISVAENAVSLNDSADVAELADASDLGSDAYRRGGSSPFIRILAARRSGETGRRTGLKILRI